MAYITAKVSLVNAEISRIRDKYSSIRSDIGILQSSQNVMDIQGYGGEIGELIDFTKLRTENAETFFKNYYKVTINARAALARSGINSGLIWEIVTRDQSQIFKDEFEQIWRELDHAEKSELEGLKKWWIPSV
ncbi:hypothetical protein M3E18_11325 [Kocuria sp. p3-SID1433]|uniref:hypothetical protein n=1 Tax=unclassified Kocuria TaxID=2649579 RepID=UPI0021A36EE0|nr:MULTISPECIES: hypothetical protein [unclassified Kocuria]MCT1602722.1 hypothetical protein [Kocuria sp. p3-SID1428]MCT2181114.1 hypothetical protein [Kocuria sp. p3-SID1433]